MSRRMNDTRKLLAATLLQAWSWQWLWIAQATAQHNTQPMVTTVRPLLQREAIPTTMFTCGYRNGDPAQGWPAPSGFDCRVDTAHGIWGFCPTTVIAATDCGLGGYCFDTNTCTSGCGSLKNNPVITTWTCTPSDPESRFCSMAFLTFGVDQTYEYFHCGPEASTAHLLAFPTAALALTKSSVPGTTSAQTPRKAPSSIASSTSTSSKQLSSTETPTGQPKPSDIFSSPLPSPSSLDTKTGVTSGSTSTGAIVGGVIGGLGLIGVLGGAITYLLIRARLTGRRNDEQQLYPLERITSTAHKAYQGGWGPSELSSHEYHVRSPVELPSHTF